MIKRPFLTNLILIGIVIALVIIPLILHNDAEFQGSDDRAEEAILEIVPEYEPWIDPLWEPPSAEVESFLFALQAAIGAGVIFYWFGYMKGKRKIEKVA
ncbi:energy-coupling factor ABC transporter substrate-binding protein [Alkaliphilus peptidifermentans]|uniref:Cobalt transport protein CbiN n=1 Tax=Alkaliphilus peptidifermentans DSM 18978 TaxID=1120976 RepID=A0A1G5ARB7_9FIRM|nr:energy-coupling factor ABC transporter substrate-binding protein [Alkaliphilus peptidifermentans]SCX80443.1 cobalt/nickel transport protein [Alkaliphilus peptidifermentans DSM 18978]